MKKLYEKKEKKIKNNKILENNYKLFNCFLKNNNHLSVSLKSIRSENFGYLYGKRLKHGIINLNITIQLLKRCFSFIQYILLNKKTNKILIVSNQPTTKYLLKKVLERNNHQKNFVLIDSKTHNNIISKIKKRKLIKLVIFFDISQNKNILQEVNQFKIPTISLVDTNFNLDFIDYPVITNIKNIKSIHILIYLFESFLKKLK